MIQNASVFSTAPQKGIQGTQPILATSSAPPEKENKKKLKAKPIVNEFNPDISQPQQPQQIQQKPPQALNQPVTQQQQYPHVQQQHGYQSYTQQIPQIAQPPYTGWTQQQQQIPIQANMNSKQWAGSHFYQNNPQTVMYPQAQQLYQMNYVPMQHAQPYQYQQVGTPVWSQPIEGFDNKPVQQLQQPSQQQFQQMSMQPQLPQQQQQQSFPILTPQQQLISQQFYQQQQLQQQQQQLQQQQQQQSLSTVSQQQVAPNFQQIIPNKLGQFGVTQYNLDPSKIPNLPLKQVSAALNLQIPSQTNMPANSILQNTAASSSVTTNIKSQTPANTPQQKQEGQRFVYYDSNFDKRQQFLPLQGMQHPQQGQQQQNFLPFNNIGDHSQYNQPQLLQQQQQIPFLPNKEQDLLQNKVEQQPSSTLQSKKMQLTKKSKDTDEESKRRKEEEQRDVESEKEENDIQEEIKRKQQLQEAEEKMKQEEERRRLEEQEEKIKQEELKRKKEEEEAEAERERERIKAEQIRQEIERKRIEEEEKEKKRKEDEEKERIRLEEEQKKQQELKEQEERRKKEEAERQERLALILQEKKRPTLQKIQYYLTKVLMSEIKIEYSEGDEEVKNQIEKFELRKLSDTTEVKKTAAPNPNPGRGSTQGGSGPNQFGSFDRTRNQPNSGNNSHTNNFNNDIIMRQAPDPDEIRILESAQKKWLQQQSNVDEKKQKQKDIKRLTNILTYDNQEKIKGDFLKYALDNDTCYDCITSIMEKAMTENKYTQLYGNLCRYLNDEIKKTESLSSFKNNFISQIQEKFDDIEKVFPAKKPLHTLTNEERSDFHSQRKKRIILLFKFIGQLYLLGVISRKVITIVVSVLMRKYFQYKDIQELKETDNDYIHYDDCLQGIIELYETTGQVLDTKKKDAKQDLNLVSDIKKCIKETKTIGKEFYEKLEILQFTDMMDILETYKDYGHPSPRVKALLQNLIERKNNNWEERLVEKERPKTLQEIKQEHERDLQNRAAGVENYSYQPQQRKFPTNTFNQYRASQTQNDQKSQVQHDEVDEEEKQSQKNNTNSTFNTLFGASQQKNATSQKSSVQSNQQSSNQQQVQPEKKEVKAEQFIDYESKVNEIYKKVDTEQNNKVAKQEEEDTQTPKENQDEDGSNNKETEEVINVKEEVQQLIKSDKLKTLSFLISMIYVEKKEKNLRRTEFLNKLIQENTFTSQEVVECLNSLFTSAYKSACDYPDMQHCLIQLLNTIFSSNKSQFEALRIVLTEDEDDNDDIIFFFQTLFEELLLSQKNNKEEVKASIEKVCKESKLQSAQIERIFS